MASKFVIKPLPSGDWTWQLQRDGKIIALSPMFFQNEAQVREAIRDVRKFCKAYNTKVEVEDVQ